MNIYKVTDSQISSKLFLLTAVVYLIKVENEKNETLRICNLVNIHDTKNLFQSFFRGLNVLQNCHSTFCPILNSSA